MLTVRSTINVAGQAVPNIIPAVQGDTGRSIEFTLADFTIPAGSTATYYVQKPSGEAVYNSATIDGNKITVELTAQSLAETGDNYGQVRILNGEDVVTSFDFILLVKPFRGIEAIESTTEMNIFDRAVQNAMANIDGMLPNIIAPVFNTSTAYTAGDYVIYSGKLYQFTAAHSGAWTGADVEECTVAEKLGEGGSGDGLTEDIKQALLQIAQKVAYVDEDGQDYYDALYDALYPPADLVSITAVYTQGGTVYDTDTLDSLKDDLVVTAHYSDQTTETITTYTLSGTLTVGTSTITVTYGGKTTTFTVTVSEYVDPRVLLYNWDLTNSLTDTVGSKTATLTGATQDSSGVHLTAAHNHADFNNVLVAGSDRTVEVDVASYDRKGTEHGRFIMIAGTMGFIYRKTGVWALYLGTAWTDSAVTASNAFDGKTVVIKFDWSSNSSFTMTVSCEDTEIVSATYSTASSIMLGSNNSNAAYNSTFTALRVYEGAE